MSLELAVAIIRVKVDRASLRQETMFARRFIARGLASIPVKINLNVQQIRQQAQQAGRAASQGFSSAFGGAAVGGGGGSSFMQAQIQAQQMFLQRQRHNQMMAAMQRRGGGGGFMGMGGGRGGRGGSGRFMGLGGSTPAGRFASGFGFQFSPAITAAGYFGGAAGLAGAGAGMAIMGAAGQAKKAIQVYADFEQAMARVQVVQQEAGASAEQVKRLENQARSLGKTTIFTATEAANAMVVLTQKGFDANEVYAQMPNVLALAAAGQMDVAQAADIVASSMKQFGMDAESSGKITDILAKAALRSSTDVEQLGTALSYVGSIAHLSGRDLQETVAAIMLLSDAGMEASRAGTGLQRVITMLTTDKVRDLFKSIGVDVRGQSLSQVLEQTQRALQNRTPEERVNFAVSAFGQRGGPAFAALLEQGNEKLRENIALLDQFEGTASRVADTMQNTIIGRTERLQSALDDLRVAFGEAFGDEVVAMIEATRDALEGVSSVVKDMKVTGPGGGAFGRTEVENKENKRLLIYSLLFGGPTGMLMEMMASRGEEARAREEIQQRQAEAKMHQAARVNKANEIDMAALWAEWGQADIAERQRLGMNGPFSRIGAGLQAVIRRPGAVGKGMLGIGGAGGALGGSLAQLGAAEQLGRQAKAGQFVGLEELSRQVQSGLLGKDDTAKKIEKNTKKAADVLGEIKGAAGALGGGVGRFGP